MCAFHIDRELGNAGVAGTRAVDAGGGKGNDLLLVGFEDDDGVNPIEPLLDFLRRTQPRFKSGHAVLNALVVDGRDGCCVFCGG